MMRVSICLLFLAIVLTGCLTKDDRVELCRTAIERDLERGEERGVQASAAWKVEEGPPNGFAPEVALGIAEEACGGASLEGLDLSWFLDEHGTHVLCGVDVEWEEVRVLWTYSGGDFSTGPSECRLLGTPFGAHRGSLSIRENLATLWSMATRLL
jgi:hypothetical protein